MSSIKFFILSLMTIVILKALEIPIEKVEIRSFGKSISVNAKIVQLSNTQQLVTSLVDGQVEKYFVQAGQSVKNGQKIAVINSIGLSQMSAEYISLKRQYADLIKNYEAVKNLYDKGMTSMQNLNLQNIQKNEMFAKIETLNSQLNTLGINADNLKKVTSRYTLFSHSDGRIASILQPLHSVVDKETPLVSIVKNRAFYVKSFIPLEYTSSIKIGQKVIIDRKNSKSILSHITQILPEVDETTQRLVVLSSIENSDIDLFINEYVSSLVYFDANKKYLSVKKSALSFYKNEWVVFIPVKEHKEEAEKHYEYEDEETMFEAKVVEIITEDDAYVAVKGLDNKDEYVSNNSYYVKSMLLKSSLGDGD